MKAVAVCFVLLAVGVFGVLDTGTAGASSGSLWTEGAPIMVKNLPSTVPPDGSCLSSRKTMFIAELGATRDLCVSGSERLKIGNYNENGHNKATVGFPYSDKMHLLEGICSGINCHYAAGTDLLVMLQPVSQYGWGIIVFGHVSARITKVTTRAGSVGYEFNATNPEYEMKNDVGRYLWTPSFNVSDNGRWIVVELRDAGLAVVDTDTFTARQITTEGFRYGYGMDPTEQLAVSNDGKNVALAGENVGFHIYDAVSGCGQPLIGDLSYVFSTQRCPSTDLGVGVLFANFRSAERPHFLGAGHEMELTINSWLSGPRRVSFATSGTTIAHQLKLLSLGDSFSSGEGETNDGYYKPGTNRMPDTCHVSTRAYATLIASRRGIGENDAKNVACSGAKIADIMGSMETYWGQGDRLGAPGLRLSLPDKESAQQAAVDSFLPGRALQSSFIERYNPEVITVGIGGNDAGLMGKLRSCAMPGTCEWAVGDGLKQTALEVRRLAGSLSGLFADISHKAGSAQVFVLGYPQIIDPDGACDPLTAYLIDHAERLYIENSIRYVNQVIRAAANKAGFSYVDIEHSLTGKKLCSGASSLAMNGLRVGDDVAIINAMPMLRVIGAETFHPTPAGHALIADAILANNPDLASDPHSADLNDIEPLPYWSGDGTAPTRSAYATDFASKDDTAVGRLKVLVPDGTLQPHSIVTAEVHSEPMHLATFVVNENGGVNGDVSIPATLSEGFHTLHLLATNRGGEEVDLYEFITIGPASVPSEVHAEGMGVEVMADVATVVVGTKAKAISVASGLSGGTNNDGAPAAYVTSRGIMGVLGTQSQTPLHLDVQKGAVAIPSRIWRALASNWLPIIVVSLMVLVGIAVVCVILVARRWAKPSS